MTRWWSKELSLRTMANAFLSVVVATSGALASDSHDCVLQHMKGVGSDLAARAIVSACEDRALSGDSSDQIAQAFTEEHLGRLTGRASGSLGTFSGTLYNGNDELAVSEVVFLLTMMQGETPLSTRPYQIRIYIPPRSARKFSFRVVPIGSDESYRWTLVKAAGFVP
jgi:hypothetical protein